jgi:hypothetical protein
MKVQLIVLQMKKFTALGMICDKHDNDVAGDRQ